MEVPAPRSGAAARQPATAAFSDLISPLNPARATDAYERALLEYATPRLAAIPGVRLIGTAEHKASVLSFVLAGHEPLEVGKALNTEGIAVRAGHHCAQPILRRMGVETTVRPSFAFYNTYDEIDTFLNAVRRIAEGGTNTG